MDSAGLNRLRLRLLLAITCTLGCLMNASLASATDPRLDTLFNDYWEFALRSYPTWATYLGDHRYDSLLTDYSPEAHAARLGQMQSFLTRVEAIPLGGRSSEDSLNHELFAHMLHDALEGAAFDPQLIPITQQGGPPNEFAELPSSHPMRNREDGANYIKRLKAFPVLVQQTIANMREGMRRGLVPARVTMERVLPQYEALLTREPAKHILAAPFAALPDSVPAGVREELTKEGVEAIRSDIIPSYRKLRDFIRDHYLRACRDEIGLYALPDGEKRYAYLVRYYTTTSLTPEEIHATGERELASIKAEMHRIANRLSWRGPLPDLMEAMRLNPKFYFTAGDSLMVGFRRICKGIDAKLDLLFGRLPKQWYDLKEMEAFRAPAAPDAYYYGAPDDGSRPAYFYVNTYRPDMRPKYTMEALAYHEAVPGHHLQLTLQQELKDLPHFRRHAGFTAFVEGWALYAELLPKEIGFYSDPYSDFGRLTFQAWRAARLVVDTGIHQFKWSREKAIQFFRENTALSEVNIESEVDRYIADPGQALAYMIGRLKIQEIRAHAEQELGAAFDIRRFHDVLLEDGALPLDLLEQKMNRWIKAEERAARLSGAKRSPKS
jgi:prolyl oligopeptidase